MPSPVSDVRRELALNPHLLAACQAYIACRLGLHFPPERWPDLERHLTRLAHEANGTDPVEFVERLLEEPLGAGAKKRLVAELTVGETYFFRDFACFQHLADQFLRPLIAKRRAAGDRRLRLWSAGCCTGEEAYSLAMLVDGLLPDSGGWQVDIIGTDLNSDFLAKARSGRYSAWSFRQMPRDLRARYFQAEAGGHWRIKPALRQQVGFGVLNLAEDSYPDASRKLFECDVILCRNVLMYFSPSQAVAALRRLYDCLSADGILLIAAVEGMVCQSAGLNAELWPGALCIDRRQATTDPFRRMDRQESIQIPASVQSQQIQPFLASPSGSRHKVSPPAQNKNRARKPGVRHWEQAHEAAAAGDYRAVLAHLRAYLDAGASDPNRQVEAAILFARAHANLGQLVEAADWAEQAVQLEPLGTHGYWVLASIRMEQGMVDRAREVLSKALYLDPEFVLAHYLSAHACLRLQQPEKAARHFENCLVLLSKLAPESLVPEGEGLSVSQLTGLAQAGLAEIET